VAPPADQVADGASEVAVKSPESPESSAAKASRPGPAGTSAVTVPVAGSLRDRNGLAPQLSAGAADSAQVGSCHSRNREAQSPP
jgi:hypothetical protein